MTGKLYIVCLLIASLFTNNLLAQENFHFDTIELPNNISNSWIQDIFQDGKGFIWFVNGEGLNRYDGYELKTFNASSDVWGSAGYHYTAEDKHGFIWGGSFYGEVFRFNPALEKFEFFNHDTTDHNKRIWDVYADKDGFIWIISDIGLYSFKPPAPGENFENINVLKYIHNPLDSTSLSTNAINTIFQDKQKRYWIGTRTNGIDILYNRVPDGKFIHYPFSPDHNSVVGNNIQDIFQDSNENIWIGTQNSGISIVVNDTLSDNINFANYNHDENNPYSLFSNRIQKIIQSKDKTIWISAEYRLQKVESENFDFNNLKFDTYTSNLNTPALLNVNEMCSDREGRLWISNYGNGVAVRDPAKYKFHHYKIPNSQIMSFFEMPGSNGRKVWVSTGAGLYLFDRVNNKFIYTNNHQAKNELRTNINRFYQSRFNKNVWVGCTRFYSSVSAVDTILPHSMFCGFKKFDPFTGKTIVLNKNAKTLLAYKNSSASSHYPVNEVYDIEEISEKYIVLATHLGIALYDQQEDKYIQKPKGPLSKLANINGAIVDLLHDSKENLWISVTSIQQRCVFRFNPLSGELRNYLKNKLKLKHNIVNKIIEDSNGDIWFAIRGLGLGKYIYEIDSISFYNLAEVQYKGLGVKNMLEDDNKYLWLSGTYLTKFDIENGSYWTYKKEDGLQDDVFAQWAAYKSPATGEMYFGGDHGFNIFHPDSIQASSYIPPVFITDFELMNSPVVLADYRETEHILPDNCIESIILNYDQNFFSFKFAALDYTNPSNNRYLYKLDGLDKEWIQSYDRKATYTNLDPGEYILRVKGSNHDGVWNEKETLLKITILPPWWRTTLAYFIYALIIISIVYLTWRLQLKRIRIKHEYEMSKFEAEKMHEVEKMKSRFFTNISHEFRTPLTLIFGPAKDISEKPKDPGIKRSAGIISRNASRLFALVNQLLDFSKLEEGKMK
ncbi:MAG: two-component regulator propeller domain-containing protein, partial [Ignavibacteriaceae bacterium]